METRKPWDLYKKRDILRQLGILLKIVSLKT